MVAQPGSGNVGRGSEGGHRGSHAAVGIVFAQQPSPHGALMPASRQVERAFWSFLLLVVSIAVVRPEALE